MGWSPGPDPHRLEAYLAGAISSLPTRIPSQRSKDWRFVVVSDDQRDQRPCRSPLVLNIPFAIDRMLRRYGDRRCEFQASVSKEWSAPIFGPVIHDGATGTSSITPTLRAQVVKVLCAASTDFPPS